MGVWDDDLPSLAAADVISDTALIGKIMPLLNAIITPWTTYAPDWTASTSDPSIGDGSITAVYRQVGKTVDYAGRLIIGSTTTLGTGTWRMSLPVTASSTFPLHVGAAWIFTPVFAGTCVINNNARIEFTATDTTITHAAPYVMGTNDQLRWSLTYEAA